MQPVVVRLILFSLFFQFLFLSDSWAQVNRLTDVEAAFESISSVPFVYPFLNREFKSPEGGHLQGVQAWQQNGKEWLLVTASSAHYSYYAQAELKPKAHVIRLQRLLNAPYRHAGGCQLFDGKLAVGVEDNFSKDKSQVLFVDIGDTAFTANAQKIIERSGTYKRSTAGATGFTAFNNGYLIAVADWNARNIDFYFSKSILPVQFDSIATYHVPNTERWWAYQNINLLTDSSGKIFLIGFGKKKGKNGADLYQLRFQNGAVKMEAISTRYFKCRKGVSFRYGAGCEVSDKHLLLYSCQRRLKKKNVVNVFEGR